MAVGTGASYARAADRARFSAGRPQLGDERGGALVAEWLDLLAPMVLDAHAEDAWPQTLVLDKTWLMVRNRSNGTTLQASHQATSADWVTFLQSLNTAVAPRMVITDGDTAIQNAVRTVWPVLPGPSLPQVGHQVAVRHLFPAHRSTAALDAALGRVRDFLDSRSFVLRNKRRTNLALGLTDLTFEGLRRAEHEERVIHVKVALRKLHPHLPLIASSLPTLCGAPVEQTLTDAERP